ncbi:hypothetical protein LTR35_017845 [Friedmanniomyces endolithicus]|nr:hypothetical protein LTR35_017845 [Friedmanniomyces endolithicus]KAK0267354.1 hypothetical protein LTS00_017823 [Friedmanniomyces endolithicus]KAK0970914.1 hypothetical protein LTR54_017886 [Friedmanniomyces endolithicus]
MPGSFITPAGQYPLFTVVTEADHTAWIVIATALGIPIILVFGAIRIFVRRTAGVGFDDILLALATFFAIVQASIILSACSYGLGKGVDLIQQKALGKIQQLYYASTIFFIIALALSKGSVAALLLRLCATDIHRHILKAVLAYVAILMTASILIVALQCDLTHPWALVQEKCPGMFIRLQVISALDIAFELAVVALSISLVYGLQAPLATKISVVSAFSFRLLLLIVIALRLATFPSSGLTTNPTLRLDLFIVWTQTELNWSIISATVPSLRPFLRGLNTYTGTLSENSADPKLRHQGHRALYMLSNLDNKGRKDRSTHDHSPPRSVLEILNPGMSSSEERKGTFAPGTELDATSLGSNDSRGMIIRKDVTWTVDHETGRS